VKSKKPLSAGMQVGDFVPKLHLTRRTLAKVLEAAPDAMVVMGADGKIVRVNTQAKKLFGYSQEELLGQEPDLFMPRHPRAARRETAGRLRCTSQAWSVRSWSGSIGPTRMAMSFL
jgi:two-component system, NarL family, sensor histidine kinase DevS